MMDFLKNHRVSKSLLLANCVLALGYLGFMAFFLKAGNPWLFGLLLTGEVYHLWQVLTYMHTVWPRETRETFDAAYHPPVAVFITVAGEPADVIQATVQAAKNMRYPNFNIYILNDGKVADKPNWREAEQVARRMNVVCFTREIPGGAKAGNINHGLSKTNEPLIAVFDADHMPKAHFLQTMVGHFVDNNVGFVQSPQYYHNQKSTNVAGSAWDQQAIFFGAICKGRNTTNSVFMCGTNMVLRRTALAKVGGMNETNIAEDFLTSLTIHEKGWRSVYVDQVLAEGLAPEDFLSYYKQQFRWARGSLEVVFRYNPLWRKGTSWSQKLEYLAASSFYLSGLVVLMNAVLPLIFFFTGQTALIISTMTLVLVFIPYITLLLFTIQATSNASYTFRALSFTLSSFWIHISALFDLVIGKKTSFSVTSKRRLTGRNTRLVIPHLIYVGVGAVGLTVAVLREGLSASVLSNLAWVAIYIVIFVPFIAAAIHKEPTQEEPATEVLPKARPSMPVANDWRGK
jgi:cellulose synthase (UDP-forming)